MNETRELANFVAQASFKDLPAEVVEKTKYLILDTLGIQLFSSVKPWSKIPYHYVKALQGVKQSTIVNYGDRVPAPHAAFVNASFGHGFEIDDTHRKSATHVTCVVVPTALALGEYRNIEGRDFLLAVALGIDVMVRVGTSIMPESTARGIHPTSAAGTFGAATTAGKILGFGPELMLHAMSVAGSHSSGFMEYCLNGGSNKRIHAGLGAEGGLRSALLAQDGLTGPPTVLEGDWGFCRIFSASNSPNLNALTSNLGSRYEVMNVAYKRRPVDYQLHAMLDAVEAILSKHPVTPSEIAQIVVRTSHTTCKMIGSMPEPTEITAAHFSVPFSIALRLIKGPPAGFSDMTRDYTEDNVSDPEIMALARLVVMEPDEELSAIYPAKMASHVFIKLRSGATYDSRVIDAKGTAENPLTSEELEDKFRKLAIVVLPEARIEELIDVVRNLEAVSDVSRLARLLVS